VHAVGARRQGQVCTVVDHEQRVVVVAQTAKGPRGVQYPLVGLVLLAELEDVHSAGERLAQVVLAGAPVGDEVEARLGESLRVGRHAAESSAGARAGPRSCDPRP
jgi:hypothetical protein